MSTAVASWAGRGARGAGWPGSSVVRRAGGDAGHDSLLAMKGIVLGLLLSLPAWIGLGVLARAALG